MSFPPIDEKNIWRAEVVAHCPNCRAIWDREIDGSLGQPGAVCHACKDAGIAGFIEPKIVFAKLNAAPPTTFITGADEITGGKP